MESRNATGSRVSVTVSRLAVLSRDRSFSLSLKMDKGKKEGYGALGGYLSVPFLPTLILLFTTVAGCSGRVSANQSTPPNDELTTKVQADHSVRPLRPGFADRSHERGSSYDLPLPYIQILSPDKTNGELPLQRIGLGTVQRGERIRKTIVIANATSEPATIDHFEISCDCLTITPVPIDIRAAAEKRLEFAIDETHENSFVGDLGIEVRGFNGARLVLNARVDVTVAR
jgi:hypothetical protein